MQEAISSEWLETKEDEIAQLIAGSQDVDKLRELARILHERGMITPAYYYDLRDTLDHLSAVILIGKRNTAALRNGRAS